MSEALYGRIKGRATHAVRRDAKSYHVTHAGDYPLWVKILFVGGIVSIIVSVLSVIASLFFRDMPGNDILCSGILIGLVALYVVSAIGPQYRTAR